MESFKRFRLASQDLTDLAQNSDFAKHTVLYFLYALDLEVVEHLCANSSIDELRLNTAARLAEISNRDTGHTEGLSDRIDALANSAVDAVLRISETEISRLTKIAQVEQLILVLHNDVSYQLIHSDRHLKSLIRQRQEWLKNSGQADIRFSQSQELTDIFNILANRIETLIKDSLGLETETIVNPFEDFLGSHEKLVVAWASVLSSYERAQSIKGLIDSELMHLKTDAEYLSIEQHLTAKCDTYLSLLKRHAEKRTRHKEVADAAVRCVVDRRLWRHFRALALQTDHVGLAHWLQQALLHESAITVQNHADLLKENSELDILKSLSLFEERLFVRMAARTAHEIKAQHGVISAPKAPLLRPG